MSEKSGKITKGQWADLLEEFNYRCAYCGEKTYLTTDHVIPRSKGGRTVKENVVPACINCNSKKSSKLWKIARGKRKENMSANNLIFVKELKSSWSVTEADADTGDRYGKARRFKTLREAAMAAQDMCNCADIEYGIQFVFNKNWKD